MKFTLRNYVEYLQTATLLTASFTRLLPICACVVSAKDSQEQQAHAKHEESVYAEITKAPEKARSQRNPFENDPDAIAAGSKLFAQHCAECHGNMAEGGKKGPSLREEEVQGAAPGALFWVFKQFSRAAPAVEELGNHRCTICLPEPTARAPSLKTFISSRRWPCKMRDVYVVLIADHLQNVAVRFQELGDLYRDWLEEDLRVVNG
jgi:Cytochrome C oxidase, cbb3-type, subunit III